MGHNRIRDKGLKAITDALLSNPSSGLRILGLRFNFLTPRGMLYLLEQLPRAKHALQEVFIRNNLISDEGLFEMKKLMDETKCRLWIDLVAKLKLLNPAKAERSIWIHPIANITLSALKRFF